MCIIMNGIDEYNKELELLTKRVECRRNNNIEVPILSIYCSSDRDIPLYAKLKKKDFNLAGVDVHISVLTNKYNDITKFDLMDDLNNKNRRVFIELPIKGLNVSQLASRVHNVDMDLILDDHMLRDITLYRNSELPCTPSGVLVMLRKYKIDVSGKSVVVIGRSYDVGIPMALSLINRNATVSICHSLTNKDDLVRLCKGADIIISATGIDSIVTSDMVKDNVIVVDIGGNDVDYDNIINKASFITAKTKCVGYFTRSELMRRYRESL